MGHYRKRLPVDGLGALDETQQKMVAEIQHWLAKGEPQSAMTYYVGDLGGDKRQIAYAWQVRKLMWNAMENGVVHLLQRRTGAVGSFEYFAVKRAVS
jgi:hypothetical protein